MLLLGYANFKSKDKTKEYYKIVLARGCTEKEKEYGNVGYKTVEKFISEEVFNTLNEKMCGADVSYPDRG